MSDALWKLSACELLDGYAAGKFSSADAVKSVVGRIEARNGELNALITDVIEDPIAAAQAVDARRAAGEDLPPLAGVPITIKENIDVTGQPTTNGLPALKDFIATDDSPLVKNFKEAGAIIERAYAKAREILETHRDKLTALAERLLDREVLFKEDLVELLGERPWGEKETKTSVAKAPAASDAEAGPEAAAEGALPVENADSGTTDGEGDEAPKASDEAAPDESAA